MRHYQIPNLLDALFDVPLFVRETGTYDIRRTFDSSGLLEVDVPGVKRENLIVELTAENVVRVETSRGELRRTIEARVPAGFDPRTVTATLNDGVLTLNVKRFSEDGQTIKIEVT